ncbi:MAG: hypothetical protein BGO14_08635 [Chlamydiales bacterium 38-26]|nr:hypothetical protein [Chlamydiales bacterium]OJV11054.1 MAG: hypothetical protein BGO14_08635 [Chlamydiales bacterium 38-26]
MDTSNKHNQCLILSLQSCKQNFVLDLTSYKNIRFLSYTIGYSLQELEESSFTCMHSLAISDALYMEKILLKASQWSKDHIFLLNPYIDLENRVLNLSLEWIHQTDKSCPSLLISNNNILIGVLIPECYLPDIRSSYVIRHLTWMDAQLDKNILSCLWPEIKDFVANIIPNVYHPPYLSQGPHSLVAKYQAWHYLNAIKKNHPSRTEQYLAVMPHHAGDVLFFSQALNETLHPFTHIGVNKEYGEIVKKIVKNVSIFVFEGDPPSRGTNEIAAKTSHHNIDSLYFIQQVYPQIPKNWAFYYFRPWRYHDSSTFHFIDQWKAALTDKDFDPINSERTIKPRSNAKLFPKISQKSVLLHFGGGWSLKIYPQAYQKELCDLLCKAQYKITIISDYPLDYPGCETVEFIDLNRLESLIKSHHILVGMDSFPGHYATYYLHHPTIMLFASTRPENALFKSSFTQQMHRHLDCNPCGASNFCPKFKTTMCSNFSLPLDVYHCIESFFQTQYQENL